MSRATVRTAIRDFFAYPTIAGLNTVYKTQPTVPGLIDDIAYVDPTDPTALSGAVGMVHIEGEHEHRITGPASGVTTGAGWKRVTYDCALIVLFRSWIITPDTGEADASEAVADALDTILEAVKAHLRSDGTLGNVVFSAGEGGEQAADDIRVESDLPRLNGETFEVWSVVRFVATEWIQA